MSEPLTLKDAFEVVDANELYADKLQNIPIKAYIVRKHELHIPYCVFKLSDKHPFRCVTCMLEKDFNVSCIHVDRVRIDYPFHVDPKEYSVEETEIKRLLDAVRLFENVLLGPLDTHVAKYYSQVMYLKGTAFKPKSVHSFVSKEQKRLVALEEEIWDGIHLLFIVRANRRFALNNMLSSKIQFAVLMENIIKDTKAYNDKVKECIALHHAEEEVAAEIYLSKIQEGTQEEEEEDEVDKRCALRQRMAQFAELQMSLEMTQVYPRMRSALRKDEDCFLERYVQALIAEGKRTHKMEEFRLERCTMSDWLFHMESEMGSEFGVLKAFENFAVVCGL